MDWLNWIVAGLKSHSTEVTAGATIVIALASVVNAWMVIETRRLRKAQTAPHLSLYFEWSIMMTFVAHLILRNDGFRQARYIRFRVDPDFRINPAWKLSETLFMRGLPSLQPNECKYISMDVSDWFKMEKRTPGKKVPSRTIVFVSYEDIDRNHYHEKFELDLRSLDNTEVSGMPPSHMDSIMKSLASIADSLGSMKTNCHGKNDSQDR